jgi:hypothetical protein
MTLSTTADWVFGGVAFVRVLLALVRSVHVKIRVNVRKLTPGEAETAASDEPKFSFEKQVRVEHGKPLHFGTKIGPPS